jgi:hypothetical protein
MIMLLMGFLLLYLDGVVAGIIVVGYLAYQHLLLLVDLRLYALRVEIRN